MIVVKPESGLALVISYSKAQDSSGPNNPTPMVGEGEGGQKESGLRAPESLEVQSTNTRGRKGGGKPEKRGQN